LETDPLPAICATLWNIQFHPFTVGIGICLVIISFLIILSALLSASEVAYCSIFPSDKHKLDGKSLKKNKYIRRNLESPETLLATILVANNVIKVGIVVLASFTFNNLFDFSEVLFWGLFIQIVAISLFLLLFGELVPKGFVTHHAVEFARFIAFPLYILAKVFRPLNSTFTYLTSFFKNRIRTRHQSVSVEELAQTLEHSSQSELKEEMDILEGIVKFGNKSAAEIMRSRVDVVSVDFEDDFSKIINLFTETGFSRIPVYAESFDHIKGILYIKDLLPHVQKGPAFRWQSVIRPPFYVPETKKIDVLLEEFQKNKVHMAIVVDEYGGTSGIVTLEDVLEEIVGEITDEFDEEEKFFTRISENKYLFDGKTMLNDFYKITGAEDSVFDDIKGEADTLAGLILELKGEIPLINDTIRCKNYVFSIEAVDNRRIKQIKVEIKTFEE
jgi:gliding motility-associated protein GldE